jgi:hypothetical protein
VVAVESGSGYPVRPFVEETVRSLRSYADRYGPYPWSTYKLVALSDPAELFGVSFWDRFDFETLRLGAYVQSVQALAALGNPNVVDCALRLFVSATPTERLPRATCWLRWRGSSRRGAEAGRVRRAFLIEDIGLWLQ